MDNYILIGKGEEYSGGRSKKAILADCLEAIIGAYYLDSGFQASGRFVHQMLIPEINKVLENRHAKDYKTLLQEHVQKRMKTYPKYRVVQKTGPDHDKTFWIEVHIGERSFGAGKGKNKKEAEQEAARIAYEGMQVAEKPPRIERPASPRGASPNRPADRLAAARLSRPAVQLSSVRSTALIIRRGVPLGVISPSVSGCRTSPRSAKASPFRSAKDHPAPPAGALRE